MPHIVAIGWLWVAFMMSLTERSLVAGLLTFVFYGLLPCGVLLYLLATPARRRRAARANAAPPDAPDARTVPSAPPEAPTPPGPTAPPAG